METNLATEITVPSVFHGEYHEVMALADERLANMINPSISGEVVIDHTTMYVMNNLYKLNFGSVDIVNIFSNVDGGRKTKECIPESDVLVYFFK